MKMDNTASFYIGTYTNETSEGIYKYQLNADGSFDSICLAAKSEFPSFLALSTDKKYLLAVNETNSQEGAGTVESFLIAGRSDTPSRPNQQSVHAWPNISHAP